jgi:hypothetical protein
VVVAPNLKKKGKACLLLSFESHDLLVVFNFDSLPTLSFQVEPPPASFACPKTLIENATFLCFYFHPDTRPSIL